MQQYWTTELPQAFGGSYRHGTTTFFTGQVSTGCGQASSQTGPFYCPVDQHVYIDLRFMQQLEQQLIGSTSDLAEQYIVAHEFGHHVQNLLGTSDQVNQPEQSDPDKAHLYSVALELQADCYAGVWIKSVMDRGLLDASDEVNEAFDAANGVGDDYIQSRGGGQRRPGLVHARHVGAAQEVARTPGSTPATRVSATGRSPSSASRSEPARLVARPASRARCRLTRRRRSAGRPAPAGRGRSAAATTRRATIAGTQNASGEQPRGVQTGRAHPAEHVHDEVEHERVQHVDRQRHPSGGGQAADRPRCCAPAR